MNPTLEILTLERDRLRTQYTAQISLLDSIICRLENYDTAPQAPVVPEVNAVNTVTAAPVVQAAQKTVRRTTPAATDAPNHQRRTPEGSKTILIRRAILDQAGPVTAAQMVTATGLPKPVVSGFMSACLARGELDRAGTKDGRKLYKPTAKFAAPAPANGKHRVESAYQDFRATIDTTVPTIKLGFTDRPED